MTVPGVDKGRGAWTRTGKDNGSQYYEWIPGSTPDGADAGKDVNYQAVTLAVKAIQARVNAYGYQPVLSTDTGMFGPKTKAGVEWLQTGLGLKVDGKVGPATGRAMWRDLVTWFAAWFHVPAFHIWGMMLLESSADPGAVGGLTPSDRGLSQINLVAHDNITVEQAFDPVFAIQYAARRLQLARDRFDEKGALLQDMCSIAQHNSPLAAKTLYEVGWVGEDEKIAIYISLVLKFAATY